MRRQGVASLLVVAVAVMIGAVGDDARLRAQGAQALTLDGEFALWTMAIKADKTTDFEQIMAKLREGLMKSDKPERRQQAAGWKVLKISKPLPDGTIAYVHVIDPVVPGADYTIMQTLYDEFPDERQQLYEMYRGAFAKNLSLATGAPVDTTEAAGTSTQE